MIRYVIRRLVLGALTVLGVSIVVFVIMRILPGDPLVAIFGPEGSPSSPRSSAPTTWRSSA